MRKFISVLLILSMLVCMIPSFSVFAADGDTPEGYIEPDISWYDDTTVASNKVYYLYDAADVLGFAQLLNTQLDGNRPFGGGHSGTAKAENVQFVLMNDVDLNPGWDASSKTKPANEWPMTKTCYFASIFDGNGHTIRGIYNAPTAATSGIFGTTYGRYTTIKNLRIENSYQTANTINGGFFFGKVQVGATIAFSNVYLDVIIDNASTNNSYTGGFIGWHQDAGGNITFDNCVFAGSINAKGSSAISNVGGFIGGSNTTYVPSLTNCASYANISVATASGDVVFAGGFVGHKLHDGGETALNNCIAAPTFSFTGEGTIYSGDVAGAVRRSGGTQKFTPSGVLYKNDTLLGCCYAKGDTTYVTDTENSEYIASLGGDLSKYTKTADLNTAVASWTGWSTNTANKPIPAILEGMGTVSIAGYQSTVADGDTFNYRIVGVLNLPEGAELSDYAELGFKVSATCGETTKDIKYSETESVYTKILGSTELGLEEYTAEDLGGDYIFVMLCKNFPAAETVTVTVTSYYKLVGENSPEVDGLEYTLVVTPSKDIKN